MIQKGDKVLFLCIMPVPHSKQTWRWCIGTVQRVNNTTVEIVDIYHIVHTEHTDKVKLYQKVNSEQNSFI